MFNKKLTFLHSLLILNKKMNKKYKKEWFLGKHDKYFMYSFTFNTLSFAIINYYVNKL